MALLVKKFLYSLYKYVRKLGTVLEQINSSLSLKSLTFTLMNSNISTEVAFVIALDKALLLLLVIFSYFYIKTYVIREF